MKIRPRHHHLHCSTPVSRWDEGLPLGNGLLGLLVWGDGRPLNLSVDRSDLWDHRPDPRTSRPEFNWKRLCELVDRGDTQEISHLFEGGGEATAHPTKLPCGRLQLDFGRTVGTFASHLDFATATATTRLGRATVTTYVHATQPLIVARARGGRPRTRFLSAFDPARHEAAEEQAGRRVADLGYPPLRRGRRNGVEYVLQRCAEGFSFVVAWAAVRTGRDWLLHVTIQTATDHRDPLPASIQTLREARAAGPARLEKTHRAWWRDYWRRGHVRLPDPRIEHLWYAEMYKLGAAARADTPPISLQAVWTADVQNLPPWRGDYHHNLNTQMSYWPVHTAGRFEQSVGFAKWLHGLLPTFRAFARDFYGAPGATAPLCHGLNGQTIPGAAPYVYNRTNIAWLTQHLWWHWRYTLDRDFLRDTAYPFLRDVALFVVSQLTPDEQGVYHIHYSSSPEYHESRLNAFGVDSTYDLANVRHALHVAGAAASILGVDRDLARHWERVRAHLQPYPIAPDRKDWPAPDRGLALWQGQRLDESHRVPGHLMPIYPLGDLHLEGSAKDRQLIKNCFHELESMGTGFWCGYSFSWLACLAARVREPRRALWGLNQYLDHFVSPNTFHLNGDFRESGASRFHYRPFTLEGNFGAAHAVHEMLLQSWGEKLRLFPAVPDDWRDVAFTDLRAEGAFVVSAWRRDGLFARAEIRSQKGGRLRIEHPLPGRRIAIEGTRRRFGPGRDICLSTRPGERYALIPAGGDAEPGPRRSLTRKHGTY